MNFTVSEENRVRLQVLFAGLFLIGLTVAIYMRMSRTPPDLGRNASGTSTAIALTSEALLGPFPTSTAPTSTASDIPSPTFTATRTPTRTPTSTATPRVVVTFTAGTEFPRATFTSTPRPTITARPTRTRTPRPRPTSTRVPPTPTGSYP